MNDAWALISKDLDPVQRRAAEDSLIQNTLLPARAQLCVSLPSQHPNFDVLPR